MTQKYRVLTEDDFMSDSIDALMDNDMSNRTNFAGEDFPQQFEVGQLYYKPQVDEDGNIIGKGLLYQCFNKDVQKKEDGFVLVKDLNINNVVDTTFNNHVNNTSNPHKVTASQVGTYDKAGIDDIVATLAKKDMTNVATNSYITFKGATADNDGTTGVLSAPGKSNYDKFLRGDGAWVAIKQGYEGFPIGFRMDWDGDIIPSGWVEENGQVLNRADYPDGWTFATNYGMVVTDVSWINDKLHGKFSSGDGATTFRMPDRRGSFARYNNTNVGLQKETGTLQVDGDWHTGGADVVTVPTNGDWSQWCDLGPYGYFGEISVRFKYTNENLPQHVITRSIRKMK